MPPARRDPLERFWEKVEKTDDCWFWRGSVAPNGYGSFFNGERNMCAHLFAYYALVGPIEDGLEIDHTCNERSCVNPSHMEPVTHAENKRRATWRRTHCPSGHPFTPENTYVYRGCKQCRICRRRTNAARYDPSKRIERRGRHQNRPLQSP